MSYTKMSVSDKWPKIRCVEKRAAKQGQAPLTPPKKKLTIDKKMTQIMRKVNYMRNYDQLSG